jgi:L-alanine-DL-glutamate epimerase-like enolase superfamily enzyme
VKTGNRNKRATSHRYLYRDRLERDADGLVHVLEKPRLGVVPDLAAIRKYLVETEIKVGGRVLYRTPEV